MKKKGKRSRGKKKKKKGKKEEKKQASKAADMRETGASNQPCQVGLRQ